MWHALVMNFTDSSWVELPHSELGAESGLGRLEGLVLESIRARGVEGATDDEVEGATGLTHQCASARRRALVLKGLVRDSGQRRATRQRRRAIVWVLGQETPKGPAVMPLRVPTKKQMLGALDQVLEAVNLARGHGFEEGEDLRAVWLWLQLQAHR